ncbi:hypothetical protein [Micromonospora sediminimaris]|nr:hypothetical protein [Micromonospora sediminimaris]
MNTVRARIWQFRLEQNAEVVATIVGQGDLSVGLARLVHINAMACDLRKVLDYRTKQLEARLLVSYLDAPGVGNPLRLDDRAFGASSRHIRGFVSECSGLGMLTAASEVIFAWRQGVHDLHNFDALPMQLLRDYPAKGVRPDLLFHLPEGPVAGEARGRYRPAKQLLPTHPLSSQKNRLRELANWSASHSDHPYFMSWFYIGPSGVAVDIFLPNHHRWHNDLAKVPAFEEHIEDQDDAQEWRFPLREELPRSRRPPSPQRRPPDEADAMELEDEVFRRSGWPALAQEAERVRTPQEQAVEVMNRLYDSAPEAGAEWALGGIPVRGTWAFADQLGDARYEILLGVLAGGPRRRVDVKRRLAQAEEGLDVCLDGRLLTVVRPVVAPRPEWAELERVLLDDRQG